VPQHPHRMQPARTCGTWARRAAVLNKPFGRWKGWKKWGNVMANPNPNIRTRFSEGNQLGQVWRPGQSGNPRGISHLQREWRLAYANALIAIGAKETGTVEEAAAVVARIVWGAALRHEAWAVHELVEAVGGPRALRLEIERVPDDEKFDPTRLSDKQLEELTRLLELAGGQLPAIESGEKPAAPSDVH
jgi:hypothetical protein